MKRYLSLLAFALVSLEVCGQTHLLGVKTGVNISNASFSNPATVSESRVGFSGGLSYDYLILDRFSIGVDMIYNQRGFTNSFVVEDGFGNPTGELVTKEFHYDYLAFPVKAGAYFGTKAFGFGQVGLVPAV